MPKDTKKTSGSQEVTKTTKRDTSKQSSTKESSGEKTTKKITDSAKAFRVKPNGKDPGTRSGS